MKFEACESCPFSLCEPNDCLLAVIISAFEHCVAVPVVAHCGTGKRAARTVRTLESKGCKHHVLNAGAHQDLDHLRALS